MASILRAADRCKHVESAALRRRSATSHHEAVHRLDAITQKIEAAWPVVKVSP